jgi:Phage tail lysozyme
MLFARSRPLLALLPLAVALASTGCARSDAPGGETIDDGSEALTENANDKIAFDYFLARGLTPVQAAGIVGNLDQESGMDPTISQYGGGPGRGIAQWSAGGRWDTSTNANVTWYAGQQNEDRWSLNLQLEFIWWELTHEGYGYNDLRAATTVTQAVTVFQDEYEICGACDSSNRIAHANAALAQFGNDGGPVWAATFVSQSWPYASAPPIQMTQYQVQHGSIDLKNTGNVTWPAGIVKLAPIPRDHASNLAAQSWLSTSRVSTIAADVAPGGTGHFEWDLDPQDAGDFQPYFGLVAEGKAWFADSGGPGDNVMQVNVHVAPGTPPTTSSSGAGGGGGAGGAGGGAMSSGQGGAGAGPHHGSSSGSGSGSHPPHGGAGGGDGGGTSDTATADDHGGCSVAGAPAEAPHRAPAGLAFTGAALAWLVSRRRRR